MPRDLRSTPTHVTQLDHSLTPRPNISKKMSLLIPCKTLSAKDASGKMIRHDINRRALGANDIHIKISYSGVCHSDIHTARGEWGPQVYPLCVGHEILGKVMQVGPSVASFKVGDIAGVGCFTNSCQHCDECKEGEEQYCSGKGGMHGTYGSKRPEALHPGGISQGGYASDFVVDANYAIRIPEKMNVAACAPLLCAGITCYSPFKTHNIQAGQSLGVVGLGGLGHMAVKIGNALGCSVTVFSRSPGKESLAREMGASNFVVSTDEAAMKGKLFFGIKHLHATGIGLSVLLLFVCWYWYPSLYSVLLTLFIVHCDYQQRRPRPSTLSTTPSPSRTTSTLT